MGRGKKKKKRLVYWIQIWSTQPNHSQRELFELPIFLLKSLKCFPIILSTNSKLLTIIYKTGSVYFFPLNKFVLNLHFRIGHIELLSQDAPGFTNAAPSTWHGGSWL